MLPYLAADRASIESSEEEDIEVLNSRLSQARASSSSDGPMISGPGETAPSFIESTDDDLASALNERIFSIASATSAAGWVGDEIVADRSILTGKDSWGLGRMRGKAFCCLWGCGHPLHCCSDLHHNYALHAAAATAAGGRLRELLFAKYGKTYDLSFVCRPVPGRKFVALNVLWTHLEQQSFPMSEEEYDAKLEGIAFYLK